MGVLLPIQPALQKRYFYQFIWGDKGVSSPLNGGGEREYLRGETFLGGRVWETEQTFKSGGGGLIIRVDLRG
jgi:hypothetical protein